MNSNEQTHLQSFLTTFDATALGEGDPVAGANLLAAMAVTLANVAPPGSGIQSPRLGRMRVGANLLVSGPLSASLVADDVGTDLRLRQNHLVSHLKRFLDRKREHAGASRLFKVDFPEGPEANRAEQALALSQEGGLLHDESSGNPWETFVSSPPSVTIENLAERPQVIVAATRAAELEDQLRRAHGGRPLVLLGLTQASDIGELGGLCEAVMDGLHPVGVCGDIAGGHLLVTDPSGLLRGIATNATDRMAWLGRAVWLVDGEDGPEIPAETGDGNVDSVHAITARFGAALSRIFAKRLEHRNPAPEVHDIDLWVLQRRWVTFLKEMETSLPGISGTARSLLVSLVFGILQISQTGSWPPGTRYSHEEVEAFARFLVRRMANARDAMLLSAWDARRDLLKRRILSKLSEHGLVIRDLYRALGIPSLLCEELLRTLEAEGLVRCGGRKWECLEGAGRGGASDTGPRLEIRP